MPFKIKITGPGVNDFEFVWEDEPTELPPVDLPTFPAPPRVEAGPDDIPSLSPIPAEAPASDGEQAVPNIDKIIEQAIPLPRRRPPDATSPVRPEPQEPLPVPERLIPDAVDNVFPEPPRQSMIGDTPIPTEQQEPIVETVKSMDPLRQLYAATVSGPSSLYDLAAMGLEHGRTIATGGFPVDPRIPNPAQPAIDFLRRAGDSARRQTRNWFGAAEEPPDVFSRMGRTTGESIVPGGPNAKALSAISAAVQNPVNELRHQFKSSALTDFEVPPDWIKGGFVSPAMAAPNQFDAPSANHTVVETVGGPKKVSKAEYATVGAIVLATAGMVLGPRIYRRFATGDLPRMRPVADAPAGTVAISKPGDLALTHHDANAGAMRLLRRTGIDPVAAREVDTTMRIQTRATANAMADSAINAGRMETPAFTFQSRTPLANLSPLESQPVRDYLHIMDTLDDLRQRSIQLLNHRQTRNVVPVVRGHTIQSAGAVRRALEQSNPEVVQIAREYWDITRNLRNYESAGEYATVSRSRNAQLKRERAHEVPMHPRQIGDDFERGSATEALADDMRNRIRARLENEAKGMYIDRARAEMPNLFTRVTSEQLRDNPRWRRNAVEIFRRGEREIYIAEPFLADVLRMDPYYITSGIGNLFYMTKRALEVTTTGELAPWFAATSPLRSHQIGKFAEVEGNTPTLAGTFLAVPRQLGPQLANTRFVQHVAQRLNQGSGGWLGQVFGQQNVQALSARLAHAYDNSLYAQLQTVGGGRGSILQQQTTANNRLTRAIRRANGPARQFLEAYRSLLNAAHNAAAFDYYRRNQPGFRSWSQRAMGKPSRARGNNVSRSELAADTRNLTGDPRIGGEYYTTIPGAKGGHATPIRFVDDTSRVSHTLGQLARGHGALTEIGRTAIPWYNATVQGMRRIGEAYLENPSKFTARTWLYYIAPTASLYLGVKSLGNDPNGVNYLDYMMNGRSEYNKTMNWYIPIPGRPVEEGIEFPAFHELTIAKRMTDVAMDHAFGSPMLDQGDDMAKAAKSVADVLWPAWPPIAGMVAAHLGSTPPTGPFGGEPYRPQSDPFDQTGGMSKGAELYARSFAPGLADILGSSYAAATQTPDGYVQKIWNGARAGLRRVVEKAPVVRNILGITPARTGNTDVMEELFSKSKEITQLDRFFKQWTDQEGLIGREKPRSRGGEEIATDLFGPKIPRQSAGINQPPPTNPLYKMFMVELHDTFVRDTPNRGGIGFQSMWDRFRMASENLRRLRKVNEGNQVTWERQLDERPEIVKYLKDNNVNYRDVKTVRNFFEKQRQDIARVMLSKIREVEAKFSKELGQKITIKDLDPYKNTGIQTETLIDPIPDIGAPTQQ